MIEDDIEVVKREPTFNVGLDYLKQLAELIKYCSNLIIKNNMSELFYSLQALQILATPRLSEKNLKNCLNHERHCKITLLYFNQNKLQNKMAREELVKWFTDLNLAIHEAGLMLIDKEEEEFAV